MKRKKASENFVKLNKIYEILSNKRKRRLYDTTGEVRSTFFPSYIGKNMIPSVFSNCCAVILTNINESLFHKHCNSDLGFSGFLRALNSVLILYRHLMKVCQK